jgi:uncharacterized protein
MASVRVKRLRRVLTARYRARVIPPTLRSETVAKFELSESSNGEFRWRLKSGNGQIIATSGEGYTSKSGAQNGIDVVKRAAAAASTDDQA